MPIRVIHGNGDLIGAAFQGVGEGFDKFSRQQNVDRELEDREKRTRIFDERVQSEVARMADQLRMDQEVHQAKMTAFNRQMMETEAREQYLKERQQAGPDAFDEESSILDRHYESGSMSDEDYQFARADIESRRRQSAWDKAAAAKRAKLGDLATKYPEAVPELAAAYAEDPTLSAYTDEELLGVLQDSENDVALYQDRQMDLQAWTQLGAYTNTILSDPNGNFETQQMLPGFLRSIGAEDNPRAAARFVGALAGEVTISSLYDDPEAAQMANEWQWYRKQQRFAQTPEGRAAIQAQAAADAGNMGLGGGGVSRGTSGAVDGQVEEFGALSPPAATGDEWVDQVEAARVGSRRERAEALMRGDGPKTDADKALVKEYATERLAAIDAAVQAAEGRIPPDWMSKDARKRKFRQLREYWPTVSSEPNARQLLAVKAEELGMLWDHQNPEEQQALARLLVIDEEGFESLMDSMAEGRDPRPQLRRFATPPKKTWRTEGARKGMEAFDSGAGFK